MSLVAVLLALYYLFIWQPQLRRERFVSTAGELFTRDNETWSFIPNIGALRNLSRSNISISG